MRPGASVLVTREVRSSWPPRRYRPDPVLHVLHFRCNEAEVAADHGPKGLWLTTKDGTVVVRSDGEKLDVSLE